MVHFSGIVFVYGEHRRSRLGAIAVNLYDGKETKLVCFQNESLLLFLSILFIFHVIREVLLVQLVIPTTLFKRESSYAISRHFDLAFCDRIELNCAPAK